MHSDKKRCLLSRIKLTNLCANDNKRAFRSSIGLDGEGDIFKTIVTEQQGHFYSVPRLDLSECELVKLEFVLVVDR